MALREVFPGRIAVVSSFGAKSAVLLHLVATIDPTTPVLFVDTGRHFPETLDYRDRLAAHLGLRGVRSIGPTAQEVARLDADLSRATGIPTAAAPSARWRRCSMRWRATTPGSPDERFRLSTRLRPAPVRGRRQHVKVDPLASLARRPSLYVAEHRLPPHPLVAEGFASMGCAPCTSTLASGEERRAGRWRGLRQGRMRTVADPPPRRKAQAAHEDLPPVSAAARAAPRKQGRRYPRPASRRI